MKRFGISFTEEEVWKFEKEQTEKWLKSGRCKKRNNHKCRKCTHVPEVIKEKDS